MKYIAHKHEKGLAILHWCLDTDYQLIFSTDEVYYYVYMDIHDMEGNLIDKDGIGGIDFDSIEGSPQFEKEMIEYCLEQFDGLTKQ